MALSSNELSELEYNIGCCMSNLSYLTVIQEQVGNDTSESIFKLNYLILLNQLLCRYKYQIDESADTCVSEDDINNLIEEANKICGCCSCNNEAINKDI